MNPNRLPPDEKAAALAVKLLKLLIAHAENDSCDDPLKVLKQTLAKLDPVADAILGEHTWMILDDSMYLIPNSNHLPLEVVPSF